MQSTSSIRQFGVANFFLHTHAIVRYTKLRLLSHFLSLSVLYCVKNVVCVNWLSRITEVGRFAGFFLNILAPNRFFLSLSRFIFAQKP